MAAKRPRPSESPTAAAPPDTPTPVTKPSSAAPAPRELGVVSWYDPAVQVGALVRVDTGGTAPPPSPRADDGATPSGEAKKDEGIVYFSNAKVVYVEGGEVIGLVPPPKPPGPGDVVSFTLVTAGTGELWAEDVRGPGGEPLGAGAVATPIAPEEKPVRFPETSWDVDPASVLSLTWTKPTADDARRAPDPCAIQWHTESWTGLKPTQEDRAANGRTRIKGVTYRYFGVFDGHGGPQCSEFLRKKLHTGILAHIRQAPRPKKHGREGDGTGLQSQLIGNAITYTFKRMDAEFLELARRHSWADGSTALTVMVTGNEPGDLLLTVANVGDCRAVVCDGGKAVRLSEDHKPDRNDERNRIASAGGAVINVMGIWRVGTAPESAGGSARTWLSVSRSFGDVSLKEPSAVVCSVPDTLHRPVGAEDCFVVTACDGVWDVLSDQEVVDVVVANIVGKDDVIDTKAAATAVVRTAHQRKSGDNLTCTIIVFPWQAARLKALWAGAAPAASGAEGARAAVPAPPAPPVEEVDDMFA